MRVFLLHIALPLAIPRLVNCKRYSSRLDDNGRDLITSDFISSSYGHFNVTFLQCGIFPIPTVSSRTQTQNSWGYQLSEKNPRITEVRVVSRSDCTDFKAVNYIQFLGFGKDITLFVNSKYYSNS